MKQRHIITFAIAALLVSGNAAAQLLLLSSSIDSSLTVQTAMAEDSSNLPDVVPETAVENSREGLETADDIHHGVEVSRAAHDRKEGQLSHEEFVRIASERSHGRGRGHDHEHHQDREQCDDLDDTQGNQGGQGNNTGWQQQP